MSDPDQLAQVAIGLVQRGDFAGAADALGHAGRAYRLRGQLPDAGRVLIAGARMAIAADRAPQAARLLDEADEAARATNQLADLLGARAELVEHVGSPSERVAAWRACTTTPDAELANRAWHRIGAIARAQLDAALLLEAIEAALALAIARGDVATEADLRIERAIAVAPGDPGRATRELDRAEGLVGEDPALRGRLLGQRGMIALIEERLDDALAFGRRARSSAVEVGDVPAYLAATSLLVMIHERRGDQLAALDEILRARSSLIDLLGTPGGELIEPALAMFEERVGAARYRELVLAWRDARRQGPAGG
ncbi:MAG: hypothetical protein NT062_11430 [Proteobacteria bacterium]|nr:hypothetical protein [Pseudomonadota bacterium]